MPYLSVVVGSYERRNDDGMQETTFIRKDVWANSIVGNIAAAKDMHLPTGENIYTLYYMKTGQVITRIKCTTRQLRSALLILKHWNFEAGDIPNLLPTLRIDLQSLLETYGTTR